jgi:hypothetical protein
LQLASSIPVDGTGVGFDEITSSTATTTDIDIDVDKLKIAT